jgi:sulfate permease, SulP family
VSSVSARTRRTLNWPRFLPFLCWPRPSAESLRRDLWAGIGVALVAIPQSLAYATLAGMPPVTGLYAAFLPCIIGVLWGSARLLAVGPVALTSLLTFASLQALATPGSGEWVHLAIWLAIYAGIIQLLFGVLRLGALANFVSYPVMAGFNNAAALIIMFSQFPALLGLPSLIDASWMERAVATFAETPQRVAFIAAFGLGAIGLLLLLERFARRLPGVLLVCIAGIVVARLTGFNGTDVVGAIPGGLPDFGLPALGWEQHRALLPAAMIVALISFTEVMASAGRLARLRRERWDENQEFIGQGLAKIVSGVSGAFPVSGSLSRSALNAFAGAASGWSSLFTAACVLACLLWLTDLIYHLPRAVLAAIVIVAVGRLLDFGVFIKLWRTSRDDAAVALLTFGATLISLPYLHWGVFSGFLVSLLFFLYRRAHPRIIEVGLHIDGTLRDRAIHALPPLDSGVFAVRMDASINYLTAPLLEGFVIDQAQRSASLKTVLLCCSPANDIDATGIDMLRRLAGTLGERGIVLRLSAVKKQVRQVLDRTGLTAQLGDGAFFATDREAVRALARRESGIVGT